jgi:addiction module RelE/StbE family toxin
VAGRARDMIARYAPQFLQELKKLNIRIRKSFKERILIFQKDPNKSQLNNHQLREPYEGFRSIDVTNDYRALYTEKLEGDEIVAYFEVIGTHKELYG